MARFQISIRRSLLITAALAAIMAMVVELHRRVENFGLNPYRVQYVAELLIEYMEKNGQWPHSWDDLGQLVDSEGAPLRESEWFQEVRGNVVIDFAFDPDSINLQHMSSQDEAILRLVVANDGTRHGATGNPNSMIFRYLSEKRASRGDCEKTVAPEPAGGAR